MWLNLLDQKYTYSNNNIWSNVSQTFSPQLGASDIHLQAFGCPLAECLTTPLETISEVQLNVFASWHRHVSSVQSTFSDGVQVRTLGRPFQNIHSSLTQPFLPLLMCAWDHCPVGTPYYIKEPIFCCWFQVFLQSMGYSSCFIIPFTLFKAADPLAAKQHHSLILPAPCWTVGVVFLELKASPSVLQTYCCSLWSNNSVFVSSDQRVFLQRRASFSHSNLSAHVDGKIV